MSEIRIIVLAVLFCSLPTLRGQTSTGEIDVIVSDATEAVVSDARVTITGAETGAVVRTLDTNVSGIAAVPLLNPGTYDVKVEKEGFNTLFRKLCFPHFTRRADRDLDRSSRRG